MLFFFEPTWEYANRAQKLCTLFGDQLRTLVPSLKQSDLEIVKQVKAEFLANHLNQTGFITASKRG